MSQYPEWVKKIIAAKPRLNEIPWLLDYQTSLETKYFAFIPQGNCHYEFQHFTSLKESQRFWDARWFGANYCLMQLEPDQRIYFLISENKTGMTGFITKSGTSMYCFRDFGNMPKPKISEEDFFKELFDHIAKTLSESQS